jgi:hypothetical protein
VSAPAGFLAAAGWAGAVAEPLGADWSSRRYTRLRRGAATAMLMDAAADGPVEPFLAVAAWLRDQGLHAPAILAADPAARLVLLEDLGDTLLARAADGGDAASLYARAVDAMLHAQAAPPPDFLPRLDAPALARLLELFLDERTPAAAAVARAEFRALWAGVLKLARLGPDRFLHRDLHAENLLVLEGVPGLWGLGILDFQDAHVGPVAYDLVSLVQDARRDVPEPIAAAATARLAATLVEGGPAELAAAVAVLGAQRALRILGVVARLGRTRGRAFPADLEPRVHRHLARSLRHPALADLARWLRAHYPAAADPG